MTDRADRPQDGPNPLADDSPEAWEEIVRGLHPERMLVCIAARMGPRVRAEITPEDIWQETLIELWRARPGLAWRGLAGLRRYVLTIAENRIRGAVDRLQALKRGGGETPRSLAPENPGQAGDPPPAVASTTPSRVASYAERASILREVLEGLPDDLREVVRLRHFEELPLEEIAGRLGLGLSAVKHRSRRGATLFQERVRAALGEDRSRGGAGD